jgi:hypothetical protein
VADDQKTAPEEAASNQQNFDAFWRKEQEKLEDMCRQHRRRVLQEIAAADTIDAQKARERGEKVPSPTLEPEGAGMPNAFFTIAPAEWKFNWHRGVQQWRKIAGGSLSDGAAIMTLHMHHVIGAILKDLVLKQGPLEGQANKDRLAAGIEEVVDYSFRWEYQGRGTIHVHVVAWVRYTKDYAEDPRMLEGRTDANPGSVKSPLLSYLEDLFHARIDVQCGNGAHCHLRYVTGYVSKASDAL